MYMICNKLGQTLPTFPSGTVRVQSANKLYLVEQLVAVRALMALVCVVGLQVTHLSSRVREGPLAVVAVVGLFPAVHQQVALQVA